MSETPVLVVIELLSVQNPEGLKTYQQRAGALIAQLGATMLATGGTPIEDEPSFAPLAIQRWPSESAFQAWIASEAYQPLKKLRQSSATMRAAILPTT